MPNELAKANRLTVPVSLAERKRQLQEQRAQIDPKTVPNRIALVFDDSISMEGESIKQAKEAVTAFARTLNPSNTAVAIYPLNQEPKPLVIDTGMLIMYANGIRATGGTPLIPVLKNVLENTDINRIIVFSDGQPNGYANEDYVTVVEKCKLRHIQVDTVFIGSWGEEFMRKLALDTDGIFLHFTDPSVFGKNLKYLAPAFRAMLTDGNIKAQVERGEI